MIYFVQMCCPTGFIKIGMANDVPRRLCGLRCASPYDIRLLRVLDGGLREERALHARFRHLGERNEWFRPGDDLLGFIERQASNDALGMKAVYEFNARTQKLLLRTHKTTRRTRDRFNATGGNKLNVQ